MNIRCVWRVERKAGDRQIVGRQCVFLQITYLIEIISSKTQILAKVDRENQCCVVPSFVSSTEFKTKKPVIYQATSQDLFAKIPTGEIRLQTKLEGDLAPKQTS